MADLSEPSDEMTADIKSSELAGEPTPQPVELTEVVLSEPSKKLATRLVTNVGFNERLLGYLVNWSTGPMQVTLYSFKEVVNFLQNTSARINPALLASWVREVQGDSELANRMEEAVKQGESDMARLELIKRAMELRLNQCLAILGK